MPWTIEKQGSQYCVIKETDNSTVACHKTQSKARRHQRALYASEPALKASGVSNYGARAGEVIRGNLVRGADGKFTSGGNASAPKPKPAKPKPSQHRASGRRGGGKPKKTDEQKRAEQEEKKRQREEEKKLQRRENRAKVAEQAGLGKNLSDALLEFSSPDEKISLAPHIAADLEKKGLVERGVNGEYRMTSSGRTYVDAANDGDVRRAADAISKGSDLVTTRQQRAQEREQRRQERERRRQEREARRGQKRGSQAPLQDAVQNLGDQAREKSAASSLTVFKDKTGRYRWVAFSSNAYRDRDGEIVSTKALEEDCIRADNDGNYGPLRWWHVQGLDIGDCDYNAMHGRVLIESGTFREEWIAERIKEAAPELEISIGFKHPITEPDRYKVFNKIERFERSATPAGRASNTFTRFFVQEATSMVKEKLDALKSLLGIDDGRAQAIIDQAEMTEKAAQSAGVAYKADDNAIAEVEEMAEAPVVEVEAELPVEQPVDDGMVYVGDMAPAEFKALMVESMTEAIAPLIGAMNFETKMRGMFDELKGTFGQVSAKKDAELAEQAERISTLETTQKEAAAAQQELAENLKELTGDQPRATRGYRASQDPSTVTTKESAAPQPDAAFNEFIDFLKAA